MALFYVKKEKKHILRFLPVLFLVLAMFALIYTSDSLTDTNSAREKEILTSALDKSIAQCYALEGAYPPDLAYLSSHYGFTYNKDHFFIDYQYIGSNLRPDVTIIEREADN